MDKFGGRLRAFRLMRGWSQEYVGLELGVSKATISKWETGRAQPSLAHLSGIRHMYAADGGTLDYLIAGVALAPALLSDDVAHSLAAHDMTDAPDEDQPRADRALTPLKKRGTFSLLDADEQALLLRFRRLRPTQRKGLLCLLQEA